MNIKAVEAALGPRLCVLPSQRLLDKSKEMRNAQLSQALVLDSISILADKGFRGTVVPRLLEQMRLRRAVTHGFVSNPD